MKRFITILTAMFITLGTVAHAQSLAQEETYKFDFGGGIGMSGYLGDANESNIFHKPGFAGNVSLRYLMNSRMAIRGLLNIATLSGSTEGWDNVLPGNKNYDFKSLLFDLGARFEFNFFDYGIGETYKKLKRWTPYLSLGVGVCLSSYHAGGFFIAPSLPMAFGVKYKIKERWNLGAEFCMTKVFGDKVDSEELTDLYQIKSSFLKNTDWTSSIQISISYEFGKRCVTCHYVD